MRKSAWVVGCFFTLALQAADPGCEGILSEVLALGGETPVLEVEAINDALSTRLTLYRGDLHVRELLNGEGRFGFVAIRDEKVVGFAVYERRAHYVQVVSVGVATELQGTGVGRQLLESVIRTARQMGGMDDVRVMLRTEDAISQGFFSALEFEQTERVPGRFDAQSRSGRLMKLVLSGHDRDGKKLHEPPQLQLAPQPQTRSVQLAVEVLPATREFLHQIDPTLENAW
jgi:ribosomal protein S18 acetylase RimI-like enzyme